eukprot:1157119-Pelagomonas_calceolata.AAC.11
MPRLSVHVWPRNVPVQCNSPPNMPKLALKLTLLLFLTAQANLCARIHTHQCTNNHARVTYMLAQDVRHARDCAGEDAYIFTPHAEALKPGHPSFVDNMVALLRAKES